MCYLLIFNDTAKGYTYYMPQPNHLFVKNKYEYSYYHQTLFKKTTTKNRYRTYN